MLGYELDPAEVGSDPRCAGVCARTTPRLCRVQGLIGLFTAGFVIGQEQSSTLALTKSPSQRRRLFAGHNSGMLVHTCGLLSPVMAFERVLRWHPVPVLVHWGRSFTKQRRPTEVFQDPQTLSHSCLRLRALKDIYTRPRSFPARKTSAWITARALKDNIIVKSDNGNRPPNLVK